MVKYKNVYKNEKYKDEGTEEDLEELFQNALYRSVYKRERVAVYGRDDGTYYVGWWYGWNTFTPGEGVVYEFDPYTQDFLDWEEKYEYKYEFGRYIDIHQMASELYEEWESRMQ